MLGERLPDMVDFATQVRPILESGCTPCHFAGGTLYQRLPFDRPETIKTLGAKLFTRLKDENDRPVPPPLVLERQDSGVAVPSSQMSKSVPGSVSPKIAPSIRARAPSSERRPANA